MVFRFLRGGRRSNFFFTSRQMEKRFRDGACYAQNWCAISTGAPAKVQHTACKLKPCRCRGMEAARTACGQVFLGTQCLLQVLRELSVSPMDGLLRMSSFHRVPTYWLWAHIVTERSVTRKMGNPNTGPEDSLADPTLHRIAFLTSLIPSGRRN